MARLLGGWPAVSIVIPAYNAADCIGTALTSVFAQTCTDYEVILVDDGSQDAAALDLAIEPWRDRLRFQRQRNAGAGAARNQGLMLARGRYIAFLDADDEWLPDFLERQLRILDHQPACDVVWSDGWIRGTTALNGQRYFETTESAEPPSFRALVQQTCTVLTSSVVARRLAIDAVRGFDARIRRGQDWDMWLRIAHQGIAMAANPEPLVWRTVRAENLSGDTTAAKLTRAIAVLEGIPRKLRLDIIELGLVYERLVRLGLQLEFELGKQALQSGEMEKARAHFARTAALGSWKVRCLTVAIRLAPALFRRAYLRSRQESDPAPDVTSAA